MYNQECWITNQLYLSQKIIKNHLIENRGFGENKQRRFVLDKGLKNTENVPCLSALKIETKCSTQKYKMPGKATEAQAHSDHIYTLKCQIVHEIVKELFYYSLGEKLPEAARRRRPQCHIRQIAIYIAHVTLEVPMTILAHHYSLDRSTVSHACAVVEDRRDDKNYDIFLASIERMLNAIFASVFHSLRTPSIMRAAETFSKLSDQPT